MADQIVRSHDTLERKVSARTRQLRKANAELQRLSEVDPLTGIFNRRKLMDLLAEATAGGDPSFSLLVLDIDHFKSINDTHGHQVGDAVLIDMAAAVAPMLRPGDAFGRVGGEEFMVILDGADAQAAMRVAERVRGRIARLSRGGMGAGAVTASIGVAQFKPGDTVAAVYQRADEALYAAKRRGRNCSMCTELTSLRAA
jgi:diguanylate cyclase (GGDEF)-like protein